MIFLEILKNVGKLIVAVGFKKLPKVQSVNTVGTVHVQFGVCLATIG